MTEELIQPLFTQHGKHFSAQRIKKQNNIPFQQHPQFPMLIDILSRKDNHHAILHVDFAPKMYPAFFEALTLHLCDGHTPENLRGCDVIFVDIHHPILTPAKQKSLEHEFQRLYTLLEQSNKHIIFALMHVEAISNVDQIENDFLRAQLEDLIEHPHCRFILLTKSKDIYHLDNQFTFLPLKGPTEADVLTILKHQRDELEQYHHVIIADDILTYAYSLAERYLCTNNTLEKALTLLDSSAARASATENADQSQQIQPVVTIITLTNVLSDWTQIPASHLQLSKFKLGEFTQGMQQRIFGQDAAISVIGHELQQAQARLQQKYAPFCSFLLAGPTHSGKETSALAMVDQLFKQLNVLFYMQAPSPSLNSIADIKVQRCLDKQFLSLKDVIRQTPYAVILMENIESAAPVVINGLHEILTTGYLDASGIQYNFRQCILMLTTSLGSERLFELAKLFSPEVDDENLDLMQLVMNEQKQSTKKIGCDLTSAELIDAILPELSAKLSPHFCQHLHIVPFLPLSKIAVEKIVRLKLKVLGKQLDSRYKIELGYAPEVVSFLAKEALVKYDTHHHMIETDAAIKQLYFTVEQAIVSQADNKNRSNQLFLQLNETGQILRCDWLALTAVRQHAT